MIKNETIERIKDSMRIEEVISDFVTLRRNGSSYKACCPFHNEKTPSFVVTPSRQMYKCFGCGKAGNAITFLMDHGHMSYVDALKYLAKKYHIDVVEEELSPDEILRRTKRETLQIIMDFAQDFYTSNLKSQEGRAVALTYCYSRGLTDATIAEQGIGWAPSGQRSFTDAAIAKGYKLEYLLELKLTLQTDDGKLIDRFRERVMFPIYSLSGRVIAFSGRTLKNDDKIAKYVNSSESELYNKSRSLLGIYHARSEIAKQNKCILVEGNVDVISMHQLGIKNVVASCGTALTTEQVRVIHKLAENITLMYDGDKAGINASLKGIDLILSEGMNLMLVLLPNGQDPDDFARTHTLQEVQDYIGNHEVDFVSFMSDILMERAGNNPNRRGECINSIADTIAKISDPIKRSVYVQMCAKRFNVDEAYIFSRISATISRLARENARDNSNSASSESLPAVSDTYGEVNQNSYVNTQTLEENAFMYPIETEVLHFLLKYGDDIMDFATDSPYYIEGGVRLSDFILNTLDDYEFKFSNGILESVYQQYKYMYDTQNFSSSQIIAEFINSADNRVVKLCSDLIMDTQEITVDRFKQAMTVKGSWLAQCVPVLLLRLAIKMRENNKLECNKLIKSENDPQKQMELLTKIRDIDRDIKILKEKLN